MAANKETLDQIHEFFAHYLLNMLAQKVPVHNEDGEVVDEVPYRLSAAEMGVITKFLKDNDISFVGDGDDEDELEQIRQRAKEAAQAQGYSAQDVEEAIESQSFKVH